MAVSKRNTVNPASTIWRAVMEMTGQPPLMMSPEKQEAAIKQFCI
jgi:hypothetical protein